HPRNSNRWRHSGCSTTGLHRAFSPSSTRRRRLPKNHSFSQILKKGFGAETQYAKLWLLALCKKLTRQDLAYCVSAHFPWESDFSPFTPFGVANSPPLLCDSDSRTNTS